MAEMQTLKVKVKPELQTEILDLLHDLKARVEKLEGDVVKNCGTCGGSGTYRVDEGDGFYKEYNCYH